MELVVGRVSRLNQALVVGGMYGSVDSRNAYSFMVGARHIELDIKGAILVADGDMVAVAGKALRSGAVRALAVRNFESNTVMSKGINFLRLALGIFPGMVPILIPVGIWLIISAFTPMRAERLVRQATAPAS